MKYERIERSIDETIEFCNNLGWCIGRHEQDLILGEITVKEYLKHYKNIEYAQKFVDFLYKKTDEFQEGDVCWFYNDNPLFGCVDIYNKLTDSIIFKHKASSMPGCCFKNCIPIQKFIENLEKDYV